MNRLGRRWLVAAVSLLTLGLGSAVVGCSPAYVEVAAPPDAAFEVACGSPGRAQGTGAELRVDVTFANVARHYSLGCENAAALTARLQTIKDLWCEGLAVPDQRIGALSVGTTLSEISGKRGATIDDGEGYVAFQCDDWLPKLIERLKQTRCCQAPRKAP